MNENVELWVTALRSGEFEQTQKRLHDHEGYCCLGVACELYRRETGLGGWELDPDCYPGARYRFVCEDGPERIQLPFEVCDWLGLRDNVDGSYMVHNEDGDGFEISLASVNDSGGSFSEIAEIIESQPRDLFAPAVVSQR